MAIFPPLPFFVLFPGFSFLFPPSGPLSDSLVFPHYDLRVHFSRLSILIGNDVLKLRLLVMDDSLAELLVFYLCEERGGEREGKKERWGGTWDDGELGGLGAWGLGLWFWWGVGVALFRLWLWLWLWVGAVAVACRLGLGPLG